MRQSLIWVVLPVLNGEDKMGDISGTLIFASPREMAKHIDNHGKTG